MSWADPEGPVVPQQGAAPAGPEPAGNAPKATGGAVPASGSGPISSSSVGEERDADGNYIYTPSFHDPPVNEADLDENGLTAQDREDLQVLQSTYDRIAERWQALSPRSRNRRLLSLAAHGSSFAAEAREAGTSSSTPGGVPPNTNYLEENYPPGVHRPGTFRPADTEADLESIPEGGRPTSKARSSAAPSTAGDADSEGPQPSADSAAAPAPSVEVPMEVDAPPEPTAEESPDEEVLLESGMVPDYDLPDYDE